MTIKGNIESIEYRNSCGHEKKIVTIVPDHRQKAFVEFRGQMMDLINDSLINQMIVVDVKLEGKIAKNSGILYNNLVAHKVQK